MKRVKCYGRAKVNTVDSSFKRNFFGSVDSRNPVRINSSEKFQQKGSSSFTSVASTSDYTNVHSRELFVSDNDSNGWNLSTYSPRNSRNLRRKHESSKDFLTSKTHHLKKFSYSSSSLSSLDLQPILTGKQKKAVRKHTSTSKSSVKQRTSKQVKIPAKLKTSYSSRTDLRLSHKPGRSKNLKSYKKGVLKRNRNTSRRHSLNKHSSIPIQPSCYEFCENPSSVINTGIKKLKKKAGGKKKQLIHKDPEFGASNSFNISIVPSFNSKHDSFWAAIQPRWSSINEYSFEIEKISNKRKKTIPVFVERRASKNTSFPGLFEKDNKILSNDGSISDEIPIQSEGLSRCTHSIAVEKFKSNDEPNVTRNDSFSKQSINLNINSSETVDSKLKIAKDSSENLMACEKSAVITCPDLILSNDGSISDEIPIPSEGLSRCNHSIAVKKSKSTDVPNVARNDNFSKQSINLNINSSENVDSKLKIAKDTSENVILCEKSAAITCPDLLIAQTLPEDKNAEIQHKGDEIASTVSSLCETVSEKLNDNEVVVVNTVENVSKGKSIETPREATESKKGNKGIVSAARTRFSSSMTVSEGKNTFKRNKKNKYLSKNADQMQEYASAKPFIKKSFYSSTPLTSPSAHTTIAKIFPSTGVLGVLSPVLQKGLFTTSTPDHSSKAASTEQNQLGNMSRISRLGRQQDLSIDSSVNLQKCPSTKTSSSVLPNRSKSHSSFVNRISHGSQNIHHVSRSCISFSKREQSAVGESLCRSKSWSLIQEASFLSSSDESDFQSTLDKLLEFCGQTRIIPFSKLYNWSQSNVRKIGEGAYGEVFTLVQNRVSSVIKVIPFSEESESHGMQSIESVLTEVTVSKCLSELRNNKNFKTRNFNKLKSVHLVKGRYPGQMLIAWDKFSDAKSTYNYRPDYFNNQQMFVIIELEYGGKDMTCFILRNAVEAESVLKQIAISLAIAEEAHLFEHRDLHLGNILVQRNASKTISYVLRGKTYSIPNHGLIVTIIDFTLSRVLHEGCIFYNDIADDDSLFNQTGDYQFQIYKDTKRLLNNEWYRCLLYSNVLWLSYVCVKLLESSYTRPSSKKHREGLNYVRTFMEKLRTCENAFECLTTCNILTSIPRGNKGPAKKRTQKVKLIDRKSLRVSTFSRASSVGF